MSKVAILGFSFRFPSTDTARYWDDLLNGRDLVTTVEPGRWPQEVFAHPAKSHPGTAYTFAAGSVGDVSKFDADFFGISPREAALMDPQQRLLLELSWEALEDAGIRPSSLRGSRCGVFIGIASADYSYRLADDLAAVDSSVATGNTASIAANRLSYFYDLRGPSMAIDTACSSSSVAFHQACRSILSGESAQALVGGVSLHLHPYGFITFSKASMLSRRGRCRVFDEGGDGYVRSEGGGVFLLKDYARAVADGDRILAVVAHSAVNTDGRKSGLTVPNWQAQAALLAEAYAEAGIAPGDIDYIEAHGTGTAVGDPIEARALGEALGQRRPAGRPLLIGSVKSNLGHLEAASGVAGLVKALYCLRHRVVPATIGVASPNPNIRFDEWNLEVATQNRPLRAAGRLVVGVNSFGFGGANAHVILESHAEPAGPAAAVKSGKRLPLLLSAHSEVGLKAAAEGFAVFLQGLPRRAFYDIAYAAAFRRERLPHRLVVFGDSPQAAAAALGQLARGEEGAACAGVALEQPAGPAFVYSGNGSQWSAMGRGLLRDPLFRRSIRKVDAIFRRYAGYSLEDELAGKHGEGRYERTEIAQPALFALQVGVTEMLRHLGVRPAAVVGHSVGEVAAAWACGALSLEAAVKVIYHRSLLQGETKGSGRMAAVGLDAASARSLLQDLGLSQSVCLAGANSPRGVTVAGCEDGLARLEEALAVRGLFYRRLDLDYAFHGPAMDALEPGIKAALSGLEPARAAVPFYSTVTGGLLDGAGLGADYWWRNIRQPVLFEQAVGRLLADGVNVFVEVGPHPVLRAYLNDCLKGAGLDGRAIVTLSRGEDEPARVWDAAGQAVAVGLDLDWRVFFPSPGVFADLPHYPWQRERHWHAVTSESLGVLYRNTLHPLLGYPLPQRELAWESQIDTLTHPTLADHVIGDAVVFPGTGFVELALAAALAWHPGGYAEVADLEIRSPLVLGAERSKLVRLETDGQDGSFVVKAREVAGSEPLAAHAAGRILREPGGILLRQAAPALPGRAPDFDGPAHEAMTRALGLAYGPAYRAIGHGWVEGDSALALFELPAAVEAELDGYHLHPALLDSAFQLLIQILKGDGAMREGMAFIPTQVGRIAFRAGQSRPSLARAVLLKRSPHSLLAEFTIFDQQGRPVAFIKDARFRSVRLHRGAADQIRHLECRSVPRPHPFSPEAAPALPFEQTRQAMKEAVRRCVLKGTHRRYSEEVDPLLDGLCSRFTIGAFNALAEAAGGVLSGQALARQAAVPDIRLFLGYLMEVVQEDGLVEPDASGWKVSLFQERQATAQDIWNSLVGDYPDYFPIIHAVGRVGMHLRPLLDGGLRLQAICPRDASLSSLRRQVLGASGRHAVGKALRDLVAAGLDKLPEGQRLGVLEMSEGPPLFALDVCQSLDFDRGDYRFVSTAPSSLGEARRLQEKFPAMGVHAIGAAGEERASTGGHASRFHLALVSPDFMDVRDALATLEYAKARLAPGASIVLLGQHPARWIDFVFGGQSGWWSESPAGARSSRQQTPQFWQRQLEQMGFAGASVMEFSPGTSSGPYLLAARFDRAAAGPAWPPPGALENWLILADEQGYSAALAERLREKLAQRGARARLAFWSADIGQVLAEAREAAGPLDGIVHLAGLNAAPPAREAPRRVQHQVERCAAIAALIKACEATQTRAGCWIVTAGAMADTLPRRRPSGWRASASSLGDSALWGFVRTLANESLGNTLRLVDLEEPFSMEAAAAALDREFLGLDDEREVVVTGAGARFVPRIRLRPRQGGRESATAAKTSVVRLGFQMPGQLRNLHWEERPRTVPGDGELEVEVHATGLNFRDVMYALGLLSDEAIENGFAGPTLGLEFAGVVRTVGGHTPGFAPGDRVVGFGPSSFGNRVVTKAGAAAHIPPGISFEAAATIPSTFFTAYYALHHLARLGAEEKVLIHGAAGGVGIAAIQVAKWRGAEIFATAGSDEKRDFLRLLGVEHIYDSRSLAFADEILADTGGKGVDVVLNSLAGEAVNRNLRVLRPFGRFLELGKRDFYENTRIGLRPFRNNISYFGIDADQLMSEQPGLTGRLFGEVMALFAEGVLYPLPYHAFEAEDVVDAFRYMQQSKQIGKVVVTYRNGISAFRPDSGHLPRRLALSPEGAYLVTGGLGGFGLRTAQWLVAKGARQLILLGRSGAASEEAQRAVRAMEGAGVRVLAAACDVADRERLQAVLADAAGRLGPLKGVVHAAMVIDDALVRNLDEEQIRRVFAPKILGAQNLHELTLDAKLDFFVLFSSATTLFGNPGQGNYVAANTWLEALARHRRGLGLPATSVLWGAIGDAGFLARHEKVKEALQNRMGGAALPAALALDALEGLLLEDRSGEGVLEFDWKALNRFLPGAGAPKFSELALAGGEGDSEGAEAENIQRFLAELSDAELAVVFTDMLKQDVGEILRIPPEKIDAARSLYVMGLDSLMGVELVVALESRFGVKLPVMSLSESPTIDKLAARIAAQLRGSGEAEAESADARVLDQVRQVASQHAAEITEDAVARFAEDIRAGGGAASGQKMIR